MCYPGSRCIILPKFISRFLAILVLSLNMILTSACSVALSGHSSTPPTSYDAPVPGGLCDKGQGSWGLSQRHAGSTPGEDVADSSSDIYCQHDGMLFKRNGDYNFFGTVFFYGPITEPAGISFPFPQHYHVQLDGQFMSGDDNAVVALNVHCPKDYGCYALKLYADGIWKVDRYSLQGEVDQRLAIGFLHQPAKKFTLAVDVHQSIMSFFINQTKVTTIKDTTYTETKHLSFGLADADTKVSPSVLFSHFKYTQLPATTPTYIDPTTSHTPYQAAVPGFGCDPGAGQWESPAVIIDNTMTIQCQPTALQMSQPDGAKATGEERFYWLNGNMPSDYSVEAQVDLTGLQDGAAGFIVRDTPQGHYTILIWKDGGWSIQRYERATSHHVDLANGSVTAQSSYHILVTVKGSTITLSINGTTQVPVTDQAFTTTQYISLALWTSEKAGSATFSHFIFTPL